MASLAGDKLIDEESLTKVNKNSIYKRPNPMVNQEQIAEEQLMEQV